MGPIERFLTDDHQRLEALLARADRGDGTIDRDAYAEMRRGLLRHIGMEEKVLLPYARAKRGEPLPVAKALRFDHGIIAAMMVPTPTPELCARLRAKLVEHDALEEGERGMYAECDALAGDDAAAVIDKLRAQPEVPVAPHYDGPLLARVRR